MGIDPKRLGMIGFSAGGRLVGSTATNFEARGYQHCAQDEKNLTEGNEANEEKKRFGPLLYWGLWDSTRLEADR